MKKEVDKSPPPVHVLIAKKGGEDKLKNRRLKSNTLQRAMFSAPCFSFFKNLKMTAIRKALTH